MGEWKLQVGQLTVVFLTTKWGSLGVRFNKQQEPADIKVYAPAFSEKEIPKYDERKQQDAFYGTRYTDGTHYYTAAEIETKHFDYDRPEVLLSAEEMSKLYPLSKDAKAISKQPLAKLNLKNISASDGYYLLPRKDYANITAYKKLIEYLGNDFIVTNAVRLRVKSRTDHNYAIFVDRSQNAVVAVEVLVKTGYQPEPGV